MADRPYTLLSCGISLDGYLDSATTKRILPTSSISSWRRCSSAIRTPHRFVGDGDFPWHSDHRAPLAEVRRIGDVVLLRYALSARFAPE